MRCKNMNLKICEFCGKKFPTKSKLKTCCSKECTKQMAKERRLEYGQPCWNCAKACGGCLWSDEDLPVVGWIAEKTMVKDEEGQFSSYNIKKCPEFVRG